MMNDEELSFEDIDKDNINQLDISNSYLKSDKTINIFSCKSINININNNKLKLLNLTKTKSFYNKYLIELSYFEINYNFNLNNFMKIVYSLITNSSIIVPFLTYDVYNYNKSKLERKLNKYIKKINENNLDDNFLYQINLVNSVNINTTLINNLINNKLTINNDIYNLLLHIELKLINIINNYKNILNINNNIRKYSININLEIIKKFNKNNIIYSNNSDLVHKNFFKNKLNNWISLKLYYYFNLMGKNENQIFKHLKDII